MKLVPIVFTPAEQAERTRRAEYTSRRIQIENLALRMNSATRETISLTLKGEAPAKVTVEKMLAELDLLFGKKG